MDFNVVYLNITPNTGNGGNPLKEIHMKRAGKRSSDSMKPIRSEAWKGDPEKHLSDGL